ncbi:MAG: P1 family peptidase [Caldilineaceae bacterium]
MPSPMWTVYASAIPPVRRGGPLQPGIGPVRTGVTVILPHADNLYRHKVRAAVHRINGFGKACGFEEVRELGVLESPIALTNTLNVWRVADALVDDALRQNPDIGIHTSTFNPVVGECNDGHLNDIQGRHVTAADVHAALVAARSSEDGAPVAEGNVGGDRYVVFWVEGRHRHGQRVIPVEVGGWTLGALGAEQLRSSRAACGQRRCGGPTPAPCRCGQRGDKRGKRLDHDRPRDGCAAGKPPVGAAVRPRGRRAGMPAAPSATAAVTSSSPSARPRASPTIHKQSRPETVLADEGDVLSYLFDAVVEAVEEAVLNSQCMAETMTGRDGHVRWGIEG